MNIPVREGETIEGSRSMRNRRYQIRLYSSVNFSISIASPIRAHMMRTRYLSPFGLLTAILGAHVRSVC